MMCCNSRKTFGAFVPLIVGVVVAMNAQSKIKRDRPPTLENPKPPVSMRVAEEYVPASPPLVELRPDSNPSVVTSAIEAASIPSEKISEIQSDQEAETVMKSSDIAPPPASSAPSELEPKIDPSSLPILPADRPEWVARPPQITDAAHYISVGGDPATTFEDSLKTIDESLVTEARKYVNQYVIDEPQAMQLKNLTADWIRSHWLVENKKYDAQVNMPSGEYHQAWVELRVSLADREIVKQWWQELQRQERFRKLALASVVGLASLVMLRGLLGFASRKAQAA